MTKDSTDEFYSRQAETYVAQGVQTVSDRLPAFLARLPAGARILELGCGSGRDSAAMIAAGFDVTPTDGSPELAEIAARRLGRPVAVLRFEDLAAVDTYDGVWANACLLHVPRRELPGTLNRVKAAIKPGGTLYASFKAGTQEGYDGLGRFFNCLDEAILTEALGDGWASVTITARQGSGYNRQPTDWLHVLAVKA